VLLWACAMGQVRARFSIIKYRSICYFWFEKLKRSAWNSSLLRYCSRTGNLRPSACPRPRRPANRRAQVRCKTFGTGCREPIRTRSGRAFNASSQTPANLLIPLPPSFDTLDDVLQLPLQSVTVGVGDPRVPQQDGGNVRRWNTVRLFVQDTWRLHERLTMNYGLSWNFDDPGSHSSEQAAETHDEGSR